MEFLEQTFGVEQICCTLPLAYWVGLTPVRPARGGQGCAAFLGDVGAEALARLAPDTQAAVLLGAAAGDAARELGGVAVDACTVARILEGGAGGRRAGGRRHVALLHAVGAWVADIAAGMDDAA